MRILTTAVLTAALAGPGLLLVAADDGPTASVAIERVEVVAGEGSIGIEGETSFAGGLVLTDEVGDASLAGAGFDIAGASVEQLDDDLLEFRITVDDLALDAVPVARMEFPVTSVDGAAVELWAWRTYANALTTDPGVEWTFTVATIGPDGFLESAADGELDGSTFTWRVPASMLGTRAGAYLSGADEFGDPLRPDPIASSCGAAGLLSCGTTYDRLEQDVPFVVGGSARVELRSPKGAFLDEVVGKVRRGIFTAAFTDLAPGPYLVRVVAEYADVFVVEEFEVTVR